MAAFMLASPARAVTQRHYLAASRLRHPASAAQHLAAPVGRRDVRHTFRQRLLCQAAAGGAGGLGDSGSPPDPPSPPPSNEWKAVSLPYGVPTAGAVFIMAGFLKLLIMCFPYSPMAIGMYLAGRADLGFWAVVKMFPLAIGLTALAKWIVDGGFHERRWVSWAIVLGSFAAMFLSRFFFGGPKPNHVLNPALRAHQQAQMAEVQRERAAAADALRARREALKSSLDAQKFEERLRQRPGDPGGRR